MNDVMFVYVIHCLADLPHKNRACFFCQNELVVENSIEQFAAVDAANIFVSTHNNFVMESSSNSQFQNDEHHLVVLESIVQLNDFRVLEAIHHFDFQLYVFALLAVRHTDGFRCETQTRRLLFAFVDCSEFSSKA